MWTGERIWNSFVKWYNTPLTPQQQENSRALSIANAPAETKGEAYVNAL
jgi:hypothetical protein